MVRLRASHLTASQRAAVRVMPAEGVSDVDLAARARSGDGWAEEALFRRHVDYIAALALRLLRDKPESEDVVQDTFLDAFSQLRKGVPPDTFRTWLAGIAVHKVHRRFRRRKLLTLLGRRFKEYPAVLQSSAHSSTSPELRTELGLLDAALAILPDSERAAWMLRYVEGYELEEVATLCGCSLATTKRRIARARAVVATHVDVLEPGEEERRDG